MQARLGDKRPRDRERRIFSAPLAGWEGRRWHLGVFLAPVDGEYHAIGFGLVHPGRRIGNYERGLNVDAMTMIIPTLPTTDLASAPSLKGYGSVLAKNGVLSEAIGDRLRAAILEVRPELSAVLESLVARLTTDVGGPAGELLSWQKDALGVVLQGSGMDRDILREYAPTTVDNEPQPPFISGLPIEEQQLANDYSTFMDWPTRNHRVVGWRYFRSGSQLLWVYMSNRRALETQLGMDLLYYHENYGSYVLVQYKRMLPESDSVWAYRPDRHIYRQLKRLQEIDEECAKMSSDPLRLIPTPSMVKLCKTERVNNDSTDLIKGMYLTRAQFSHLLDTREGPRGGKVLTYDNVPRYLNNTMFTELLKDGWIGSSGVASDYVKQRIEEIEGTNNSLVVAVRTTLRRAVDRMTELFA
jgi:hypothetical protein